MSEFQFIALATAIPVVMLVLHFRPRRFYDLARGGWVTTHWDGSWECQSDRAGYLYLHGRRDCPRCHGQPFGATSEAPLEYVPTVGREVSCDVCGDRGNVPV